MNDQQLQPTTAQAYLTAERYARAEQYVRTKIIGYKEVLACPH